MIPYIRSLSLVSDAAETQFIYGEQKKTCFGTDYPFNLFPVKGLQKIEFEPITIFYGGNGSGKTTLLNVIAEKLRINRRTPFNSSPFFDIYVSKCHTENSRIPVDSRILTSDDVFDYLIDVRNINEGIDARRNDILADYYERRGGGAFTPPNNLTSLEDYEEWKKTGYCRRKKTTASGYVRENVMRDIELRSNGESAIKYFVENITENALYLLDEPENSLSIALQNELKSFLEDSARFFGCQLVITTHSPVLLSMKGAKIYDLDSYPVGVRKWTELENVRRYFDFFETHRDEFLGE